MTKSIRCVAALVLAACVLGAQELTVTMSPNPAPVGATITITAQATTNNLYTPFGCLIYSIRAGSPTGTIVRQFPCTFLSVAIPIYGSASSRTASWNQAVNTSFDPSGFAPPGLYWVEIQHVPGMFGSPTTTEWYSVTISDPANPTPALAATNTPLFGQAFQMSLSAGGTHALEPYGVALSFTTNSGFPIPGGYVSLDMDPLFDLSLTQNPGLFVNFTGTLDFLGNTFMPIQINVPAVAGILVVPIHAQAVVFPAAGGYLLSNDLTIHIH